MLLDVEFLICEFVNHGLGVLQSLLAWAQNTLLVDALDLAPIVTYDESNARTFVGLDLLLLIVNQWLITAGAFRRRDSLFRDRSSSQYLSFFGDSVCLLELAMPHVLR